MAIKILIVEDDEKLRSVLLEASAFEEFQAVGVSSAEEAVERLEDQYFDVVITDVTLPGMSGLDLLPHCFRLRPDIVPIVITAYGTIDMAVEAMKRGATEFLPKPFELEVLIGTLRVAAKKVTRRPASDEEASNILGLITKSPQMKAILARVEATARSPVMRVLITGETGTGKELIARAIHKQSPRAGRPFIALNCAAIPENLLEDELFGHVKGAFTGANTAREGRFEQANGGTLFLDEIGDMNAALQSKLLRVLQENEFEKLGSSRPVKVDVRVLAATSADLPKRIKENSFRQDLYYRLNPVHLHLPPLRERKEDIRPIAEHLLTRFIKDHGLVEKTIADEAWRAIENYRWPGNVRQLQNAMECASVFSGDSPVIHLADLPEEVRGGAESGVTPALTSTPQDVSIPDEGLNFDAVVTEVERELLLKSLDKSGGNKMRAAKLLNMKRTTFVEKLKRLKIDSDEKLDSDEV